MLIWCHLHEFNMILASKNREVQLISHTNSDLTFPETFSNIDEHIHPRKLDFSKMVATAINVNDEYSGNMAPGSGWKGETSSN